MRICPKSDTPKAEVRRHGPCAARLVLEAMRLGAGGPFSKLTSELHNLGFKQENQQLKAPGFRRLTHYFNGSIDEEALRDRMLRVSTAQRSDFSVLDGQRVDWNTYFEVAPGMKVKLAIELLWNLF